MLSQKKVGDSVYVVSCYPEVMPRDEVVEFVGNKQIRTTVGNQYDKRTGSIVVSLKRKNPSPDMRAWPDREAYALAFKRQHRMRRICKQIQTLELNDSELDEIAALLAVIQLNRK